MKFYILLFCFSLTVPYLKAEPWGKDADLCYPVKKNLTTSSISFAEKMIHFHQNVISCADGPRSHYSPSSSQYTLDSMRKYGFFKGYILGCDRLLRENSDPWVYKTVIGPEGNALKLNQIP